MTRKTDNHAWTVPVEGDNDYQSTFDSWFTDVDRDIEIRDVEANLSDYQAKDGAKFVATDTGAVYLGDGTSWNLDSREVDTLDANTVNAGELLNKSGLAYGLLGEADANSPWSETTDNLTVQFADEYDVWTVLLHFDDIDIRGNGFNMQVNGDTGANYADRKLGRSESGGLTHIRVGWMETGLASDFYGLTMSGRWQEAFGVSIETLGTNDAQGWKGTNGSVSSPLEQFTLTLPASLPVTVEAYGRDL